MVYTQEIESKRSTLVPVYVSVITGAVVRVVPMHKHYVVRYEVWFKEHKLTPKPLKLRDAAAIIEAENEQAVLHRQGLHR